MPGEDVSVYPAWSPRRFWEDVAVSSDGTYMAAVERTGSIWLSTDSGATWTENTAAGKALWERVDISDDGQIIVATKDYSGSGSGYDTNSGLVWSTDGGSSWNVDDSATADYYRDASLFAGNTKIVAIRQGQIGVNEVGASLSWTDVDVNSSANDDVCEAVVGNHEDTSGDSGNQYLLAAITRGDGTTATPAKIYVGTYDEEGTYDDSSWSEAVVNDSTGNPTDPTFLSDVAVSADGQYLAAASGSPGQPGGTVYYSTNFGQNWEEPSGLTNRWYSGITITDDGNGIFFVSNQWTSMGTSSDPGLWKSTDALSTFSRFDDESTDDLFEVSDNTWHISASATGGASQVVAAAKYDGNLFISTDGGANWELKQ